MKVLQAPVNTANQPWLMAQGLRLAGHDAEVWQYVPNKFGYAADRVFEGGADARSTSAGWSRPSKRGSTWCTSTTPTR